MNKKLRNKIIIAAVALVAIYIIYRQWGIKIIMANIRKNEGLSKLIADKAEQNGSDFETQLKDDAKYIFNKTGFEWYK